MDITACKECGILVDIKKVKLIDMMVPDDPKDNEKDDSGYYTSDDLSYNEDTVWEYNEPLDTWKCPVCKEFNGISKED